MKKAKRGGDACNCWCLFSRSNLEILVLFEGNFVNATKIHKALYFSHSALSLWQSCVLLSVFQSQIQFYGFWNLFGYFVCCAKPFPIPCTLPSLLPILLFCMCLGNSCTQWIAVPGMLSSVKGALASLGLVRSTQLIYLLFLLAPGMSFKKMQNNPFMTLCFYFQSPDSQMHKEKGISVCKK